MHVIESTAMVILYGEQIMIRFQPIIIVDSDSSFSPFTFLVSLYYYVLISSQISLFAASFFPFAYEL